jgi:hypothetical protein
MKSTIIRASGAQAWAIACALVSALMPLVYESVRNYMFYAFALSLRATRRRSSLT